MAGNIGWIDLTAENAEQTREFYEQVVGWKSTAVEMGDYSDYAVAPPDAEGAIAGICHKTGVNASQPGGWLIYITVEDLAASKSKCLELGGKIIVETRDLGPAGKFCVIEDPSGAISALFESA